QACFNHANVARLARPLGLSGVGDRLRRLEREGDQRESGTLHDACLRAANGRLLGAWRWVVNLPTRRRTLWRGRQCDFPTHSHGLAYGAGLIFRDRSASEGVALV